VETALADAQRRFAAGTYAVWYPLLPRAEARALPERLAALGLPSLRAELQVGPPGEEFGLYGSGMFIVNPPWTLYAQLPSSKTGSRSKAAMPGSTTRPISPTGEAKA
jgi:23S rRNA (adenine2030-N6)-methyltransferase